MLILILPLELTGGGASVSFQLFPVQEAKSAWNTADSVLSSVGEESAEDWDVEWALGSMGVEDVFFLMCVIATFTLALICPAISLS